MNAPVLAPAMQRAKKDRLATLLAKATAAGVRFRFSGARLQVTGAGALHQDDQACLRRYIEDVRQRLEPPAAVVDLLEQLDVEIEVITDESRAREVLAVLPTTSLGFDIETVPLPGNGSTLPWIKITKDGRRAVHQPAPESKDGLDPIKARPRLAQIYDPTTATVYILDFRHVPIEVLKLLEHHRLIIHNSAFEHSMLSMQGVRLQRTCCTLQMARLAYGAERGGLRLAEIAADLLGLDLPKDEQLSDWGAMRLSAAQLSYAAADAVIAQRVAGKLWQELDGGARNAFKLGNPTVPVVAAMKIEGVPFVADVHERTIAAWEAAYVQARNQFVALTGEEPPLHGRKRSEWLDAHLPEEMLSWWPRTPAGLLRARSADLDRLAAVPAIRPWLEVITADKRLRAFGHNLLEKISPDGRLRMDLKACWTKTGRCSCSDPNLQQLPQDVRNAVIAPPGKTLVIADLNQIELRVASEKSGDEAMRRIFRDGGDIHKINAEDFVGCSLDALPEDEREIVRGKAKRIGFGTLYGSGARGLVASAWSMYRIDMNEAEAQQWKDRFYDRYPQLRAWQNRTADEARVTGVLRSVAGRPLRAEWEPIQPLKWTLCCNYPVQSSAADVMLLAMAKVHAALERLDARLILQVHDELVIECAEAEAAAVAAVLKEQMTAAFLELFPDAPVLGLVDVAIRKCWAKPPKAKRE